MKIIPHDAREQLALASHHQTREKLLREMTQHLFDKGGMTYGGRDHVAPDMIRRERLEKIAAIEKARATLKNSNRRLREKTTPAKKT